MLRWGLMLLRSKLFLLSPAPHPSNARGVTQMLSLEIIKVLGANAASQQTFLLSPAPNQ